MVPSLISSRIKHITPAVICLLAIGLGSNALAQEGPSATRIGVGGGLLASTSPIKEANSADDLLVVPWIVYDSTRFYFRGIEGGLKFLEDAPVQLTLSARAAFGFSWDADDSPYLAEMDDRKITMELGGRLSKSVGSWQVSLAAWQDALGRHDSQEVELSVGFRHGISRQTTLVPYIELSYLVAGKANYYFGVRADEVRPDRPQYKPGAALIPRVGLRATYGINEQWSVLANVAVEMYPDVITDSPIVDDGYEAGILIGLLRWF